MNSHNPYSEDELDPLVRGALKARVSGLEPPDRVWTQIKGELEAEQPPPRRSQVAWSPLAVQAALTLLLVMLGGFGLRTLLDPGYIRFSSGDVSPSQTIAYVGEQPASSDVPIFDDEAELRSLKAGFRPRPESRPDAEPNDRPSVTASPDVPPNMLRLEERVFEHERSLPLIVEVQHSLRGGPYPW